jgi:hypothetical protein
MRHANLHKRVVAIALFTLGLGLSDAGSADFVIAQENLIQFTEQTFLQQVFGNQRSYDAARKQLDQALSVQIAFVENAVELSDEQIDKLELAGRGDIHRFFSDFERVKRGMKFGGVPRDEWQAVWQKTQPLSLRYTAGLHGPNSLLKKTIASTLDDQQRQSFDGMQKDRAVAIYVDNIRMTLAMLDRKVPLTRRQRESVIELLVNETEPPDFYGRANMQFYVVLSQMGKLPQDDLKELFDQNEWRVVQGMLQQAKAIEQTLKAQREALEQ